MATILYFKDTLTTPSAIPQTGYRDLSRSNGLPNTADSLYLDDVVDSNGERQFASGDSPTGTLTPMGVWSERLAVEATIAGSVEFTIRVQQNEGGGSGFVTGRLRARLFKITAGGSAVETHIVTADASTDLPTSTTATNYTLSATPAVGVIVAPHERLIVRVYVTPHVTTGFGSNPNAYVAILYGHDTVEITTVTLTETVTMQDNGIKMFLRRTASTGIGVFKDLSETQSVSAGTSEQVLTQEGGTEIQWTSVTAPAGLVAQQVAAAQIASTSNAATYVSASFTPTANRLYLLWVVHADAAPEATVPTVTTTTGLNFVQVGSSMPFNTIASNAHRITLFRAMKASGLSAGTYTVTLADSGTACCAMLTEHWGTILTTGTDGADAIRNVMTNSADSTADPIITMGPFNQHYNGVAGGFGSTGAAPSPPSGFGSATATVSSPTTRVFVEWKQTAPVNRLVSCTQAANNWAGIAVELVTPPVTTALMEWISPRTKEPWEFDSAGNCSGQFWGYEQSSANCGMRVKIFHRAPDETETLVYTVSGTTELDTSVEGLTWTTETGVLNQAMTFREDDRLVVRAYIINIGTMGGGMLCFMPYDAPADNFGDSYMYVYNSSQFKAEGDPAAVSRISDGQSMSGIGN